MVTSFATQENELFGSLVQEVKVEIDEIEVEVPNKNVEESYPPPTKISVGAGCGCKQILISSLGEADHIQHGKWFHTCVNFKICFSKNGLLAQFAHYNADHSVMKQKKLYQLKNISWNQFTEEE